MRLGDLTRWKCIGAHDHLVHGERCEHCSRGYEYAELGDERSFECRPLSGDFHVHVGERFDHSEPGRNYHLHADGSQCCWGNHGNGGGVGDCSQ